MKKRILSLFLAFVMTVGLLPMSAFAADTPFSAIEAVDGGEIVVEQLEDAKIDNGYGTEYTLNHYHITVPAGTTTVEVTYPSELSDFSSAVKKDGEVTEYLWNTACTVTGTVISIPVADHLAVVEDGVWVSGTAVMPQYGYDPINMFTFEYEASDEPSQPEGPGEHDCVWNAGVVTKAATCLETGIKTYTCTVSGCSETKTEDIPLADHAWNSGEVTKEATCKEVGKLTKTCTVNGCGQTKAEDIPLADHAWNSGQVTKEATCKEAGVKTYSCTVSGCTETKTSSIPKLTTHTYGEDGEAEYCSVCKTALNPDYVDPNMPEQVEGVYQIGSADQLLSFAKFVNKGNTNLKAVLTADIDLTGKTWTPMTSSNAAFGFDGQGHTIIFDDASNGLFAVLRGKWNSNNNYKIDTYATVENVIIAGTIRGAGNVAAIAGEAYGVKITKCLNQADITSSGNNVGGMIGLAHKSIAGFQYSNIMIDQCANTGSIQGASNVGGLVGAVYNNRTGYTSYITNSYNWGSVVGSKNGGLIGNANYNNSANYSAYLSVTNCYHAGSPTALVGSGESSRFTISNTYYLSETDTSDQAKTAEEMKSADFVTTLGEYYRKSGTYPVLSWQAANGAAEYGVTKPTTAGITFTGADMAYTNEDYTFTVTINNRYEITKDFAVLVNGNEVNYTLDDGKYLCTISQKDIASDLVITVQGVVPTKTVLYTGNNKPLNWLYVSEIAIDDVRVKSTRTEGNTIYVVLEAGTTIDAEVYFTVEKGTTTGSSGLYMLNISPASSFTRQLNGGSLTETITAEIANNDPVSWTIVVTVDGIKTYNVALPTGTGYTVKGATAAVGGQDYTFTVELDSNYMQGENFAVKANGNALKANEDGSYTVKAVDGNLEITVDGVVEKPFEDPFVSIKAGDQILTAEEIQLKTKDFHLGGAGVENFDGRVYENIPYYQVIVDSGIEFVEVVFKAVTDILSGENSAYGYTTDISDVDAISSATIRGTSFEFTQNDDGTKSLKIPVTGYTVNTKGGKAIGPEMEGQSNQPVALFSFLHEYSISVSENDAFTVVPQEGYSTTVLGGDDFKFTVLANPGYSKGDKFAVRVGDETVTPDENGVYTIANITEDKTIAIAGAAEAETVRAYLSVSHDATFVKGEGGVAVLQEVEVPWFDLSLYGLEEYAIAEDAAGYQEPTLLHLYIVATEIIYCGLDADEAGRGYLYEENLMSTLLNATQAPGSLYMADFWGYDENLRYFYNYEYPYYPGTTTGATSDRIILEDGDVATVGHFTDWKAHEDSANGFNYLVAGENDEVTTSVEQGEELVPTVRRAGGGMGGGSYDAVVEASVDLWYTAAESVPYGDVTTWTYLGTTTNGVLTVEVDLTPGEYVVAVAGQKGAATQGICSAPGAILLTVEEKVETDADRDAAAAKVVYDLIEALPSEITLGDEERIVAAREAYNALTSVQKTMVFNLVKLTAAENTLAALKDAEAAKAVDDQIEAIGNVTLEKEAAIRETRIAYNMLSDAQKALVTKLDILTAAELELDRLKNEANSFADMYQATKTHLASLSAPTVGSTNGEWRVIGLVRSGGTVADSYYDAVVSYAAENIKNGRLHTSKSTENSRVILALTALGKDVTNVGGHDLLSGLNEMSYIGNQGINGTIWALIAFDSADYTIPAGDVSREALIAEILSKQKTDGGWALSGDTYDSDMTGMALQALAPYYKTNAQVKDAVDKALTCLSNNQQANGGFLTDGSTTSESAAQVITALTALGIDPDKDSRFIKNGLSALDALTAYYLGEGKFEHGAGGGYNAMATEQAFYGLVAYDRYTSDKTALYDMSDVEIVPNAPVTPDNPGSPSKPDEPSGTPDFGLDEDEIDGYVTVSFEDFGKRVSGETMDAIYQKALGTIIPATKVPYAEGDTVAAVTLRLLETMDFTESHEGSAAEGFYLEAIGGFTHKGTYYKSFGEFDAGVGSGWMITWNGWFIDKGASDFTVKNGDVIRWQYTCQLGADIGDDGSAVGGGNQAPQVPPEVLPEEPPVTSSPYTDVTGHWAEKAISVVHEKGLMTGTKEDTFSPETELSRAMLVTILYRMAGEPAVTADNTFSDVTDGTWYTNAVIWASQNGIVNGVGQDRFAPDQDITREQMAAMLLRYSDYKGYDTTQKNDLADYTDADQISTWALAALQWANGEGLITGRKADLLVPQGDTTRAETATILMRYLETIA